MKSRVSLARVLLGVAGIGFALYGARGILTHQDNSPPLQILPWWIAVVIAHDAIIAPVTALTGWLVIRRLPAGARAPVQFAGIVCGLLTLFAIPLLRRQGHGFGGSTLLTRDYHANLIGLLVAVVIATTAVHLVQTRRRKRRLARQVLR